MTPAALALISLIGTVAGILGAFSWSKIVRVFGLFPLDKYWHYGCNPSLEGLSNIQEL